MDWILTARFNNRRRGLALGLMMAGLGAGSIAMPPLAQRLIASFGWRAAFAIVGGAILIIPMPIVGLFLRDSPQRMGLLPDGVTRHDASIPLDGEYDGLMWREIWQSGTFWLLIVAFALAAASIHACIIHMPELFADRGATTRASALASSVVGFALLVGRIGTGYFLDRYFGP